MERCLYCYKELKEGQVDYHPACARKLVARCESRRKERAGPFYHRGLVGKVHFEAPD